MRFISLFNNCSIVRESPESFVFKPTALLRSSMDWVDNNGSISLILVVESLIFSSFSYSLSFILL